MSYSWWYGPATPSTPPPTTWILPPTAASATSLSAAAIGAFFDQLPCALAAVATAAATAHAAKNRKLSVTNPA